MPPRIAKFLNVHLYMHCIGCTHDNPAHVDISLNATEQDPTPQGNANQTFGLSYFSIGQPTVIVDLKISLNVHLCTPTVAL